MTDAVVSKIGLLPIHGPMYEIQNRYVLMENRSNDGNDARILESATYLVGISSPSSGLDLVHGRQLECSSTKFFKLVHALVMDMLCLRNAFCIF